MSGGNITSSPLRKWLPLSLSTSPFSTAMTALTLTTKEERCMSVSERERKKDGEWERRNDRGSRKKESGAPENREREKL